MTELTAYQADTLQALERDPYTAALLTWLEGKPKNTRRSYRAAISDFFDTVGKESPADVRPLDVASWKEQLKARGRSDSTVAQRLSAVSSYYRYLQKPQANGVPICDYNPVDGVGRNDLNVSPYERARKLSLGDFQRILAEIDTATVAGARDRAILIFYYYCARRRSEVVNLRGRDLRHDGDRMVYRVRLKGGKTSWKELPSPVWISIQRYLDLAGRTLSDDSPVFVATCDNGRYLRQYHGLGEVDGEQPLSGDAIQQRLRCYAKRAGLDPKAVTLHSLRHLGAQVFTKANGGDVRQTQLFLDHAHLNTTQIYLQELTGQDHNHWQAMQNALGA